MSFRPQFRVLDETLPMQNYAVRFDQNVQDRLFISGFIDHRDAEGGVMMMTLSIIE